MRNRLSGRHSGALVVAVAVAACVTACGSNSTASPATSPSSKAAKRLVLGKGDVTAVSASSITIATKKGKTQTFSLAPGVVVTQKGHKVPATALTPGESVVLYAGSSGTPGASTTVAQVKIKPPPAPPSPSSSPSPSAQ